MRRIGYAILFIILLAVFTYIAVFVVVNPQTVALNLLIQGVTLPIGVVVLFSLVIGALLTLIACSGLMAKSRLARRKLRRRAEQAERESRKRRAENLGV